MRPSASRPLALLDRNSCWGCILPIKLAIVRAPALIYVGPPRDLATVGGHIQYPLGSFPEVSEAEMT